ncbi:HIT family protein [Mangrovitalea sediminis]|uniref:HIT family protein n=1 Tax=Mangrovitalea sediminis TaxID=1982043 RepID=UPI000BE5C941|nr:HIT family protein [Mangrovitalea sediminis]
MPDDCIFCAIADNKADASMVYEDDQCVAFMDIHPIGDGHVLVIPRQHALQLTELSQDSASHLFGIAQRILRAQRRIGQGIEGSHILVNDGPAANQQVAHIHIHLIPRRRGDGLQSLGKLALHITGLFGRARARDVLELEARQLREALSALED